VPAALMTASLAIRLAMSNMIACAKLRDGGSQIGAVSQANSNDGDAPTTSRYDLARFATTRIQVGPQHAAERRPWPYFVNLN